MVCRSNAALPMRSAARRTKRTRSIDQFEEVKDYAVIAIQPIPCCWPQSYTRATYFDRGESPGLQSILKPFIGGPAYDATR